MFQTGLHEINFRLCSVNFTWVKPSWHLLETRLQRTLLEDASTEIYIRLHSMNFTWDYTWNLLLRLGSREFYLSLHPLNFTWEWTWRIWFQIGLQRNLLDTGLHEIDFRLHSVNFTWDWTWWMNFTSVKPWWILPEATSILCRKEQRETFPKPSSKDLFEKWANSKKKQLKSSQKSKKHWCSFDAVLMQFWKLHQNGIKTASKLHQDCINVFLDFSDDFICFFLEFAHFFK